MKLINKLIILMFIIISVNTFMPNQVVLASEKSDAKDLIKYVLRGTDVYSAVGAAIRTCGAISYNEDDKVNTQKLLLEAYQTELAQVWNGTFKAKRDSKAYSINEGKYYTIKKGTTMDKDKFDDLVFYMLINPYRDSFVREDTGLFAKNLVFEYINSALIDRVNEDCDFENIIVTWMYFVKEDNPNWKPSPGNEYYHDAARESLQSVNWIKNYMERGEFSWKVFPAFIKAAKFSEGLDYSDVGNQLGIDAMQQPQTEQNNVDYSETLLKEVAKTFGYTDYKTGNLYKAIEKAYYDVTNTNEGKIEDIEKFRKSNSANLSKIYTGTYKSKKDIKTYSLKAGKESEIKSNNDVTKGKFLEIVAYHIFFTYAEDIDNDVFDYIITESVIENKNEISSRNSFNNKVLLFESGPGN